MPHPHQAKEHSTEPVPSLWASQHIRTGSRALRRDSSGMTPKQHSWSSVAWLLGSVCLTLKRTGLLELSAELRQNESPRFRSWHAHHGTTDLRITLLCGAAVASAFLLRAAENKPVKTCRNWQLSSCFSHIKLQNWCQVLPHSGLHRWYCFFNVWHSCSIPTRKETSTTEWMNGKTNCFKLI